MVQMNNRFYTYVFRWEKGKHEILAFIFDGILLATCCGVFFPMLITISTGILMIGICPHWSDDELEVIVDYWGQEIDKDGSTTGKQAF